MSELSGLSILLVEDEYLIALDAEQILRDLGARSVEVVSTFDRAKERAETSKFDLVVLDVNLNGELSFPIAHSLKNRGVPMVFASGYQLAARSPPGFENAICVGKPYTPEGLKSALMLALANRDGATA